jgi:hypothetical protein
MASVYKLRGDRHYTIQYRGADGRRKKRTGYTDKAATERLAAKLEEPHWRQIREGLLDVELDAIGAAGSR